MGNGRLGEVHALLHVACAKARLFPDGTSPLFFKRVKDTAARAIGDGVQHFSATGDPTTAEYTQLQYKLFAGKGMPYLAEPQMAPQRKRV